MNGDDYNGSNRSILIMDNVLDKIEMPLNPLRWANFEFLYESKSLKAEIYLPENSDIVSDLIKLFHSLFKGVSDELLIYSDCWGDFTLDTWNMHDDDYNYSPADKENKYSRLYLEMLNKSSISPDYKGSCKCMDWNTFLDITVNCIVSHIAMYGHIIYSKEYDFFFYFHHTGSIGLYYQDNNPEIKKIIDKATRRDLDIKTEVERN